VVVVVFIMVEFTVSSTTVLLFTGQNPVLPLLLVDQLSSLCLLPGSRVVEGSAVVAGGSTGIVVDFAIQ
jgi:hypothetical protein